MSQINEINLCEVCGNSVLEPVLDLGTHPMCDDLIKIGDSRVCKEYPIEILYCEVCKTAHQRFQIPKQDLFPKSYHYRSRFTADVLKGMRALTESTNKHIGSLSGKLVMDVGCNDGSLLDFFQEKGAKTIGIEPTNAYKDALGKGHTIINGFFSPQSAMEIKKTHGSPDVITFTNVFAHIENLPEVIEALKILISPETMIVIENHYLGAVLKLNQFDTFYHEHPRTYSLTSFHYIAKSLGCELKTVEFPHRYGGNIRVFMASANLDIQKENLEDIQLVLEKEAHFGKDLKDLQQWISKWQKETKHKLNAMFNKTGKIVAKAFPGRAAILVKLLALDADTIEAVYEKPGSMKIGSYLPGTRIPIDSDETLFSKIESVENILNLAWHIPTEIENYLKEHNFKGNIVNIIEL